MLHASQKGGVTRLSEDSGDYLYYRFYPSSQLDYYGRAGFYWVVENGRAFQAEAGEVFLALPGWYYWNDEPLLENIYYTKVVTDVASVVKTDNNVGNSSTAIYTLNGRKIINQPFEQLSAGIYIVNGKNVIKK